MHHRRNFTVRMTKTKPRHLTQSTIRPKQSFQLAKTHQEVLRVQQKINQAWVMVKNVSMDISSQMVIKYLGKRMKEKLFRYRSIILDALKAGELPKLDKKIEDFSQTVFAFEVEQMLEELQIFLQKRIHRDNEVLKEQIKLADYNIQDAVDVEDYQRLVCSFRPTLITNSSDLAKQYDSLGQQGGQRTNRSCRIQQNRYQELGRLERQIAAMHNQVYVEKQNSRVFDFYQALKSFI